MISTKNQEKQMTPDERKQKVNLLREEHQDYFNTLEDPDVLFIPKMAYRPSGKDEVCIGFFPSELQKEQDIYTEFVSIDYESEDTMRTLYLLKYNPFWREEYELSKSKSGYERYFIPVSELKVINDIQSRNSSKKDSEEILDLSLPDPDEVFSHRSAVEALISIAQTLKKIEEKLK